jgi:hypothetical protein
MAQGASVVMTMMERGVFCRGHGLRWSEWWDGREGSDGVVWWWLGCAESIDVGVPDATPRPTPSRHAPTKTLDFILSGVGQPTKYHGPGPTLPSPKVE